MAEDAKYLQKLVKQRDNQINANEAQLKKDKHEKLSFLDKIREDLSVTRCTKNDEKEKDRQRVSRTLMAALVTAADYPGCPDYVPAIINVLKNILGIYYSGYRVVARRRRRCRRQRIKIYLFISAHFKISK